MKRRVLWQSTNDAQHIEKWPNDETRNTVFHAMTRGSHVAFFRIWGFWNSSFAFGASLDCQFVEVRAADHLSPKEQNRAIFKFSIATMGHASKRPTDGRRLGVGRRGRSIKH